MPPEPTRMNPSENPPENRGPSPAPASSRLKPGTIAGVLLAVALAAAAFLAPGCGKTHTGTGTGRDGGTAQKADPWEVFAKRIHKDTDTASCKSALAQLSSDLPNRPDVDRPGPVSDEAKKAIT